MLRFASSMFVVFAVMGCSSDNSGPSASGPGTKAPQAGHEIFILAGSLSDELKAQLTNFIGTDATAGDLIHVVHALEHRRLVRLVIPAGSARSRLRDSGITSEVSRLGRLSAVDQGGRLDLARLASTVQSLRETDAPVQVLLLGSLLYADPEEEGWSMSEGRVPSDGALCLSRSDCPLGPKNGTAFPGGTEIYWYSEIPNWGVNERHRAAVVRCWAHFFKARGARLRQVTGGDLRAVFQKAAKAEAGDGDLPFLAMSTEPDGFVGMWDFAHKSVAVFPTQTAQSNVLVMPVPKTAQTFVPPEDSVQIENAVQQQAEQHLQADQFMVAILWKTTSDPDHCDIDLRLRSPTDSSDESEVNYQRTESPLGRLIRDVRAAQESEVTEEQIAWEAMEVHRRPGDVEVWLNAYHVTAPVTVRVILLRKTPDGTIQRSEQLERFEIDRGDHAGNRMNRMASKAWKKLDLK